MNKAMNRAGIRRPYSALFQKEKGYLRGLVKRIAV